MIINLSLASVVLEDSSYDVCILGAGAAGITLALKLAEAGQRVALCEAGDLSFEDQSQDVYIGSVIGDPYFDLDACRLRQFGGSTNHWGGKSRSFDPIDFQRHSFGSEYTWPISHQDIEAYLAKACEIIEVDSDFDDEVLDSSNGIKRVAFNFSPPVNFSDKYLPEIQKSKHIHLFLNANFVDLLSASDGNTATNAVVENYEGDRWNIFSTRFVFALGGIENSRILLWLREKYGGRYFDAGLPIGQYWMEHPHFVLGEALVSKEVEQGKHYALTNNAQVAAGILNCGLELDRQGDSGTRRLIKSLLCVAPSLGERAMEMADRDLVCGVRLRAAWEQAPNAENRVKLSASSRDQFGIPQTELHWSKGELDRRTIEKSVAVYNDWLQRSDLGRIRLDSWLLGGSDYPDAFPMAGNHHMGGTRMGSRRDLSVVDSNCRVHGAPNIYVAGSSVFVTSGHANPTLPLLQLTLRLADHLAS